MLKGLLKRVREDEGFTLIELMVVVLIIGILVAIALPTFLGARTRAQDKAATSNLRNAAAAADTYFTDQDTYVGFDATEADNVEPAIDWEDNSDMAAAQIDFVGVAFAADEEIVLVAQSASGKGYCYAKVVAAGGSTNPGVYQSYEDTAATDVTDAAVCEGPLDGTW